MNNVTAGDAVLPLDSADTFRCRRFLRAHLAPMYSVSQGDGTDGGIITGDYDQQGLKKALLNFRGIGKDLRSYSRTKAQLVFSYQDGTRLFHIIEALLKD